MTESTLCDYCGKELGTLAYVCCGFSFCVNCLTDHRRWLHPSFVNVRQGDD